MAEARGVTPKRKVGARAEYMKGRVKWWGPLLVLERIGLGLQWLHAPHWRRHLSLFWLEPLESVELIPLCVPFNTDPLRRAIRNKYA